jgi:hypothetical protein
VWWCCSIAGADAVAGAGNRIDDAGAVNVADILMMHPNLLRLYLHINRIGVAGCTKVMELLHHPTKIKNLMYLTLDKNSGYQRGDFDKSINDSGVGESNFEAAQSEVRRQLAEDRDAMSYDYYVPAAVCDDYVANLRITF